MKRSVHPDRRRLLAGEPRQDRLDQQQGAPISHGRATIGEDAKGRVIAPVMDQPREQVGVPTRRHRREEVAAIDDVERQLAEVGRETETLSAMIGAAHAERDLVTASRAQLTSAVAMLGALREGLEEIEPTNDRAAMQKVVEQLVSRIVVRTEGEGKKRAWVTIQYNFSDPVEWMLYGTGRRTSASIGRTPDPSRA
jgi:hypothetical protein